MQKTFGELLRELRTRRGWSGERLANEAGLSQGLISKYENDDRHPKRETVLSFAHALGANAHTLLHAAGFASEMDYMVYMEELATEGSGDYDYIWREFKGDKEAAREIDRIARAAAKSAATKSAQSTYAETYRSVAEGMQAARNSERAFGQRRPDNEPAPFLHAQEEEQEHYQEQWEAGNEPLPRHPENTHARWSKTRPQ